MRVRSAVGMCALAALAVTTRTAEAGDEPRPPYPADLVSRSATLPGGMVEVMAPLGVNLSSDRVGEPVFFAPTLSVGVTDDVTVAVRHVLGLCFSGTARGCPQPYNDVGVGATWRVWRRGRAEVAIGATFGAASFDPFLGSIEARVHGRWGGGPFAFAIAPALTVGLNDRDTPAVRRIPIAFPLATTTFGWNQPVPGNREILSVPATVQIQVIPSLAAALSGALLLPVDPASGNPGDYFTLPVGAAILVTPGAFDVGASLTFGNVLGAEGWPASRRGEWRAAQIFFTYRG